MKQIIHNFVLLITALCISANISIASSNAANGNSNDAEPTTKEELAQYLLSNLKVVSAKAKPSLSGRNNSAAYVTLKNESQYDMAIIRAIGRSTDKKGASSIANRVEMHIIATDDRGVSKMVPVNRLVIPAKSELVMKPGGIHIMLIDLKKRLDYGEKIYIDFIVEQAGNYKVEVPVGNV